MTPRQPTFFLLERRDTLLGRVVHVSARHREQEARCRVDQLRVLREPRHFSEQSVQDDALTEPEGPQQNGDRRALPGQPTRAFQFGGRRIHLARLDAAFEAGQQAYDMLGDIVGRHAREIRVAPQFGKLTAQAPHHVGDHLVRHRPEVAGDTGHKAGGRVFHTADGTPYKRPVRCRAIDTVSCSMRCTPGPSAGCDRRAGDATAVRARTAAGRACTGGSPRHR